MMTYIGEDAAKREGKPFDPKNVLRTWEGFRTWLISSFGGHSDHDRALNQWIQLVMQPGKIDHFIDEMIRLANVLGYSREFVKDKARMGMTVNLRHVWAHIYPPPGYMEYQDRLRQMGHQLEDVFSFNRIVTKEQPTSNKERSDDRQTSQRKQRKERKGSGPCNPKRTNQVPWSLRPQESEHAKAHKNIV